MAKKKKADEPPKQSIVIRELPANAIDSIEKIKKFASEYHPIKTNTKAVYYALENVWIFKAEKVKAEQELQIAERNYEELKYTVDQLLLRIENKKEAEDSIQNHVTLLREITEASTEEDDNINQ